MPKITICNTTSFITIVNKECTRILRIWAQTILPPIITITLYFLIFGILIGKKIGSLYGHTYIQYIIPGLIMMGLITNSYSNVAASFFSSKFQKNIEEILISPTSNTIIILGFILGGIFRAFIIFIFIIMISLFFSNVYLYNKYLFILISLLTAIMFSLIGLINGIYAKNFDDISIVPTFVLTPLIYLGGIFYSIDLLPQKLKIIATLNPIFYIVNIFRYSIINISEINIMYAFSNILVFILLLYYIAFYLLKMGWRIKK